MRIIHIDFDRFLELFSLIGIRRGYFSARADGPAFPSISVTAMFRARDHIEHFIKTPTDYEKLQMLKGRGFIPVRRILE